MGDLGHAKEAMCETVPQELKSKNVLELKGQAENLHKKRHTRLQ